jgi:N-carbamoyl-L-amino-acid hydrolase
MVASGVFAGEFSLEYGLSRTALDGTTIGQELDRIGYAGERPCGGRPVQSYFEAHIEQGPLLEGEQRVIGVVQAIQGQRWFDCTLEGMESHAGTTPMDLRRDALGGAVAMIGQISEAAIRMGRPAVATVGRIQAFPGGTNIIPGRCEFTVDSRHAEPGPRRQLLAEIEGIVEQVAGERELDATIEVVMDHDPVPMSAAIRAEIETSIESMGLRYLVMPSGAGHDSEILAPRFPTAMLFVPSRGGKSHTPEEYTPIEQVVPGVQALAGTLHRLAYGQE